MGEPLGCSLTTGLGTVVQTMPTETDLPCPECGVALLDQTIDAESLPGPSNASESVTVAECPDCGGRFYPDRTLDRLFPDDEIVGEEDE